MESNITCIMRKEIDLMGVIRIEMAYKSPLLLKLLSHLCSGIKNVARV